MKRLLFSLLAALALPTATNAESSVLTCGLIDIACVPISDVLSQEGVEDSETI